MTHLTLAFLGPPQVQHGDRSLTFPTRKALALLVYLAVEGDMQPREKLAPLFWPESDRKAGRASLRTTLAILRKELAHAEAADARSHLRVERNAIGFNPDADYDLDLAAVQAAADDQSPISALQSAAGLIRGEFLEGFSLPDAPQFDDWVTLQQEQWHLRLGQIFERLSTLQMEGGDPAGAVETLNRWLALNPLEERAYRRLMRAHVALGDRPGALQVYEKCQAVLDAELGVEPAPETAALAERVRNAELGMRNAGPQATATHSAFRIRHSAFNLPLAGRAEEHGQLVAAYHHARRDRARVVTVEGEAGIGKTHLARHFLNWATAQGATVLRGRAFETGGRLPYQPIVNALRSAWQQRIGFPQREAEQETPHTPTPAHPFTLSPTWLAELSRLLPELHDAYPDLPTPAGDETAAQSRLFEAVARLGQALATDAPVVLFIDDVQWAGAASRDLLQYVTHRWVEAETPLLLLCGLRTEALARAESNQADASLRDWLSRLGRALPLTRLDLGPLSEAATGQLVASLGVPAGQVEPVAQWLFAETGGQPFYLAETIKALLDEGVLVWRQDGDGGRRVDVAAPAGEDGFQVQPGFIPPGVRDVLLGRLSRLSAPAFRLLAAGAVLGQAFSYRQLSHVSGVAADDGLAALDELLASHLLVEAEPGTERPYLFAHDKIRDVVYTEAGDARRRLFHERAYVLLDETGAAAAQIAHHALAAGMVVPAFHHALAAGDEAMDLFAVRDAVDQYKQAHVVLQAHPQLRPEIDPAQLHHLYRRLGRGYELLDEWDRARAIGTEMLDVADAVDFVPMKVTALNRLAAVAIQSQMDVEKAADLLETAVALADAHDDRPGLAEATWNLAQTCFYRRDRAGAIHHGERALELAQSLARPRLQARSHNVLSYAKAGPASLPRLAEAKAHAAAARDLYASLENKAMEIDCLVMLAAIDVHSGRPGAAESTLRRAREDSVEIGNVWGQANTAFNLAQALLEKGQYGEAQAWAEEAVGAAQSGKPTPMVAGTLAVRGSIYRALRALDKAREDHLAAERIFIDTPNPHITHLMAADLCADHALAGAWEKAYRYARQAIQYDRTDAWLFSAFQEWLLVAALLHGGDVEPARQAMEEFVDLVGDNPRYQIPYQRGLALLAEHDDNLDQAVTHLEAALAHAEAIGLPGEQWQLLAALARLAEERGDEETAVSLRTQSRQIVESLAETIDDLELREGVLEETVVDAGLWPERKALPGF